ncbi:Cobalamin biosynthesis protein G CbiG [Mesorhizobium plurifarium]|uniref:Cobalamin biosynthesis protein G CbiG n=1 Tax=Mesorhizobium plurifarium TaxID=69974 RepID=A0A0K2VRT0_MESPL|nr:Cobalamin biosynthesis protein G CbiG [Mesorhizobium plurifarium]
MMVAGIGSRKGVSVEEVLAAIETALEAHGLAMTALSALATAPLKKDEAAISAAGRALNLPVVIAEDRVLQQASPRSRCDLSQSRAGTPSVSEASALAVAGAGARLLGPRTVVGPVTCAIAISGDAP